MLNFNIFDLSIKYWVIYQSKKFLVIVLERDGGVSVASLDIIKITIDNLHT